MTDDEKLIKANETARLIPDDSRAYGVQHQQRQEVDDAGNGIPVYQIVLGVAVAIVVIALQLVPMLVR